MMEDRDSICDDPSLVPPDYASPPASGHARPGLEGKARVGKDGGGPAIDDTFNGSGFTNGDGLKNGLGLTDRPSRSSRDRTKGDLCHNGRGLTNGNSEGSKDGLGLMKPLINGLERENEKSAKIPERGAGRRARKRRSMMKKLSGKTQVSVQEIIDSAHG